MQNNCFPMDIWGLESNEILLRWQNLFWPIITHRVLPAGAQTVREEPRFVTARAGESVILGCDVSPPLDGQQPPYVVEWFKFGVPIPFFINFRFYPPHVDPEYTGKIHSELNNSLYPERFLLWFLFTSWLSSKYWFLCQGCTLFQYHPRFLVNI